MERTCENMLDAVRNFFEENGSLTPEIKVQLDNLGNMEKNFQAIKRIQNENTERIETLEKMCNQMLLNSNALVRCNAASHALALAEITEKDESEFPEVIQTKLKGIRRYLKTLREKNGVLDTLTTKLNCKFIELIKQKSPISEEEMVELELIVMELESEIEIAESWQKKADDAWKSLDSEATSYIAVEEKAAKYKVAATTCIATGAAVGCAAYCGVSKLAAGATAGLMAGGGQMYYQTNSMLGKYNKIRDKIAKLREDLDRGAGKEEEFKIRAANIQKLAEKKLKVKDNGKGKN